MAMVYIVKRYKPKRKERKRDPKYNRKENCRIIDSNDRTCQKISDSKDRKDSNIRKDSKNRNGPVMRSHDRSPVIVSFVTLPPVYAKLSSIISSSKCLVKTVVRNGNHRRVDRRVEPVICIFCIANSVTSTKLQAIAKSFI